MSFQSDPSWGATVVVQHEYLTLRKLELELEQYEQTLRHERQRHYPILVREWAITGIVIVGVALWLVALSLMLCGDMPSDMAEIGLLIGGPSTGLTAFYLLSAGHRRTETAPVAP